MPEYNFIHVGKTGGLSLHKAFVQILKKTNYVKKLTQIHGKNRDKYFLDNYYMTSEVKNLNTYEDNSIIIWVRDPISRLISCCNFQNINLTDEIILSYENLDDFFNNIRHVNKGMIYYLKNKEDIAKNKKKFFFVGRTENWDEDFTKLLLKISNDKIDNIDEYYYHKHKSVYKKNVVGEKVIKILKEYLKEEYRCIEEICKIDLLPLDYYNKIYNKKDYYY